MKLTAKQIVTELENRKGQHVKVTWSRLAKTLKDCPHTIAKRTTAFVRSGIDYANLATVQSGIEAGTRGEVQSLPWGEWIQFPFIIGHKGIEYVRLYPASFDNLKPSVEWTRDGEPVQFDHIEKWLLSSEKRRDEKPADCFTIKANDVVSID